MANRSRAVREKRIPNVQTGNTVNGRCISNAKWLGSTFSDLLLADTGGHQTGKSGVVRPEFISRSAAAIKGIPRVLSQREKFTSRSSAPAAHASSYWYTASRSLNAAWRTRRCSMCYGTLRTRSVSRSTHSCAISSAASPCPRTFRTRSDCSSAILRGCTGLHREQGLPLQVCRTVEGLWRRGAGQGAVPSV